MEKVLNQNYSTRLKEFFGFDWQFALTDDMNTPGPDVNWRNVQLPHDWSVEYPVEESAPSCGSGGYAKTGIGWYRKKFVVENLDVSNIICIYFEGVYMNCDVWVNTYHIGKHIYGYTSFEFDITNVLLQGENEILVRVNNSHQPGSRWYTGSGIVRPVYLVQTPQLHIKTWGVYITTPKIDTGRALVRVETSVAGASGKENIRIENIVMRADGKVCGKNTSDVPLLDDAVAVQNIMVDNPERWGIDTPVLYTLISNLYENDTLVDSVQNKFGIREISYNSERGFLLNGKKVILQGVCLHHDGGCVGAAVPKQVWYRRLKKLKEMGANAIRCSHNPPNTDLLDLADEMGFVVMDEAFDEWEAMKGKEFGSNTHESRGYSEWFSICWQDDMKSMIVRDRNHPSIIMWSIGNEVREQVLPNGWVIAKKLAGLCHALDPSRPITQACDMVKAEPTAAYEEFLQELDIVGVNYTDRWRERTETFFDEEKIEHPDWLLLGTEDICIRGVRGDYRAKLKPDEWSSLSYTSNMLKAEKLWKYIRTRPFVIGSFMWTGIDYLGECFWPEKSASCGVLDTCGFEKDGFYFYQSQWVKNKPVLYACPHLNLEYKTGTIYPLIVYTNCYSVEVFINGVSYGVKAYEFPAQGMTKNWANFDRPLAPVTTNDLHLSWDIPYGHDDIVVIGYNANGEEIIRQTLVYAGEPAKLGVTVDRDALAPDGRDVAQLEIKLLDENNHIVPDKDLPVTVEVTNGVLLGMDNGCPCCHDLYKSGTRDTFRGLAYAVIQSSRTEENVKIKISAPHIAPVMMEIPTGKCGQA